ncbi:MAG: LPS export ABC transporter ATP-binding protein [Desulfobacteraceae bacterium]|nr:LPS export ABC transporter ATP-binding protein [Desulfobacteraceae bacterium]
MAKLALKNLAKSYKKRQVVHSITLSTESGTVAGLLGPNGAGKTTTFYMTIGMIRPDSGQVLLDDEDITELPMHERARKGIGYLPQETSIFRKLTVKQNILVILETRAMGKIEQNDLAEKLLEELGILSLAHSKASVLSGGERRRLEIARALATDPSFILLDEPFAGIDPLAVNDIKTIIIHLKKRGIGVLISDHNVRETLEVCDKAYIVNQGNVIVSGTPEQIASSETAKRFYLGSEFSL